MRLNRLRLNNIRSYEKEEIVFPDGSILLSGDIGSGKTSILMAIEFALFGLQPGQRGFSLLSNGKDSGSVQLEFEIDGHEIIIERGLKRGSKTVTQDYASLAIDGDKIESSVTEIKTKTLELLNYPSEFIKKNNLLYKYTVYTPQEHMKQIILEDPEVRLDSLRHIFGVDRYKRIKENLSTVSSKLREETRTIQVEVRDLDSFKEKIEKTRSKINDLKEKIKLEEDIYLKLKEERKNKEKELSESEEKVRERDLFMQEIEKTKIVLSGKLERFSSEEISIKELEEKMKSKKNFDEQIFSQITKEILETRNNVEALNENYMDLSSRIKSLDLKTEEDSMRKERIFKIDICPTCLQNVSEVHKHNILNSFETSMKNIEKEKITIDEQTKKLFSEIEKERTKLANLESKKREMEILKIRQEDSESIREKLSLLNKSRENLIKDIEFLKKHILQLKQSALEFSKYDSIFKSKQEELKKAFKEEKTSEIKLAEFRKEMEISEKEIVETEKNISYLESKVKKLVNLIELESWLSNDFLEFVNTIEKNILFTLRKEFSQLFNKWFSMLTTDSFFVHLDENFTPIITQGDFEIDYSYLSGGERTAVALAYRLALNQVLNSLLSKLKTQGLVILDEPTDGFSDQQLDKVRDILQELNAKQLILVSHEQKIESFVDHVVKLRKEAGISGKK